MTTQQLFDTTYTFPNADFQDRYSALVGLDELKVRLEKDAQALIRPDLFEKWSDDKHGLVPPAVATFLRRPPVMIFAGDVGTGKTEMAMTIGDRIARMSKIDVELHCLSLRSRGTGTVGEMTALLSEAFSTFQKRCAKRSTNTKPKSASILLIDEADAIAQSRESAQMHHEDRAGVNALIRGIDDLANSNSVCMVLMCTNRLNALDPAIQRRAAAVFQFVRPSKELAQALLEKQLNGLDWPQKELDALATRIADKEKYGYSYTFSDVTQRIMPAAILAAYPDQKLTPSILAKAIDATPPTPPFQAEKA